LFDEDNKDTKQKVDTKGSGSEDIPKMNDGIIKTVSDDFDSYALFTFEYSITG
jgi:hypothetical protein